MLYVLILIVAWVGIVIALAPRFRGVQREKIDAERVFTNYFSAVVKHDFVVAYQQCGSEFRQAMPYDDFVSQQESLESKYGSLQNYKELGYNVTSHDDLTEWRAVILADLIFQKGTARFELEFRKENGAWMLFGFKQI